MAGPERVKDEECLFVRSQLHHLYHRLPKWPSLPEKLNVVEVE